jgi:hypothetical protein
MEIVLKEAGGFPDQIRQLLQVWTRDYLFLWYQEFNCWLPSPWQPCFNNNQYQYIERCVNKYIQRCFILIIINTLVHTYEDVFILISINTLVCTDIHTKEFSLQSVSIG